MWFDVTLESQLYEQDLIPVPAFWEALKRIIKTNTGGDNAQLTFDGSVDILIQNRLFKGKSSYDVRTEIDPVPAESNGFEVIYGQQSHQLMNPLK